MEGADESQNPKGFKTPKRWTERSSVATRATIAGLSKSAGRMESTYRTCTVPTPSPTIGEVRTVGTPWPMLGTLPVHYKGSIDT